MNAKQESDRLVNAVLPLAEKMLRMHGEFYPYGGYMKPDGSIVDVGANVAATDHPKSNELIPVLQNSLRALARAKECKAFAIVFDVVVSLPGSGLRTDALQVCVEHVDGYSAEVFFPYQIVDNEVVYGEIFAQPGKRRAF